MQARFSNTGEHLDHFGPISLSPGLGHRSRSSSRAKSSSCGAATRQAARAYSGPAVHIVRGPIHRHSLAGVPKPFSLNTLFRVNTPLHLSTDHVDPK